MPTIAEWLDGLVEHTQRAMEGQCWACDEHGVREQMVEYEVPCDLCDETGRAKYDATAPCVLCKGTRVAKKYERVSGVCDVCGGGRVIRKPIWDPYVQVAVLSACMSAMSRARSEEKFATMNEVLDWAEGYLLEAASGAASSISEEDVQSALGRMKKAGEIAPRARVKLSGGALTPEELADLGIGEDGR